MIRPGRRQALNITPAQSPGIRAAVPVPACLVSLRAAPSSRCVLSHADCTLFRTDQVDALAPIFMTVHSLQKALYCLYNTV